MKLSERWIILSILILYSILVFAGNRFGLPDKDHVLSYYNDETQWIEDIAQMGPPQYKLNPYPEQGPPTLYIYVYGAALGVAGLTGYIPLNKSKDWLRNNPDIWSRFYMVGRYLQWLFGLVLLGFMWRTLRDLWGLHAALFSTSLFSLTPAFVGSSHFNVTNVSTACLMFISLCFMLYAEHHTFQKPKLTYLAALFCGFGISMKYSGLALLLPLFFHLVRNPNCVPVGIRSSFLVLVGFLIGTPWAVLSPGSFFEGFIHHSVDNAIPFPDLWTSLTFPFSFAYQVSMGLPLLIFTVIAFFVLAYKPNKLVLFILIWSAVAYIFTVRVGIIATSFRVLVFTPAFCILVGLFLQRIMNKQKWVGWSLFAVLWVCTLAHSMALVNLRRSEPLQKTVSTWLDENVPRSKSIGVSARPFWWTPDVILNSHHHPERMEAPYKIETLDFNREYTLKAKPDYIVLSDREKRTCQFNLYQKFNPRCDDYFKWLFDGNDYEVVKRFEKPLQWARWTWNRPNPYGAENDDLVYTPMTIFKRRAR